MPRERRAEVSLLPASPALSTVAQVERSCSSSSTEHAQDGVFDVMSKQLRSIGFDWRPNQKEEVVRGIANHLQTSSSSFIQSAVNKHDRFIAVVYAVIPSNDIALIDLKRSEEQPLYAQNRPQYWTAIIIPEEKQMILEAPSSIQQLQRDVITSILDIAEEIGCEVVYASVKRTSSPDMKDMVRALMYIGFSLVPPSVKTVDGCIVLGIEL